MPMPAPASPIWAYPTVRKNEHPNVQVISTYSSLVDMYIDALFQQSDSAGYSTHATSNNGHAKRTSVHLLLSRWVLVAGAFM